MRMTSLSDAVRTAASQTERNPTDAQKESGNYAKGKVRISGLEIAIENPKGGTRSGIDKGGKRWSVTMPAHYGYVKGSEGKDGDHVDCYIGPKPDSSTVWVVDQVDAASKRFDEHKCMLGYATQADALADYKRAFSDGKGKDRIGSVTTMSMSDFKDWLRNGNTKAPMAKTQKNASLELARAYATGGSVTAAGRPKSEDFDPQMDRGDDWLFNLPRYQEAEQGMETLFDKPNSPWAPWRGGGLYSPRTPSLDTDNWLMDLIDREGATRSRNAYAEGGTPKAPTTDMPNYTLGGKRMEGKRPLTIQEQTMLEDPLTQMGRDAGALVTRGIDSAGFGIPGIVLDYAAPKFMDSVRENESLANMGTGFVGDMGGSLAAPYSAVGKGLGAAGHFIAQNPLATGLTAAAIGSAGAAGLADAEAASPKANMTQTPSPAGKVSQFEKDIAEQKGIIDAAKKKIEEIGQTKFRGKFEEAEASREAARKPYYQDIERAQKKLDDLQHNSQSFWERNAQYAPLIAGGAAGLSALGAGMGIRSINKMGAKYLEDAASKAATDPMASAAAEAAARRWGRWATPAKGLTMLEAAALPTEARAFGDFYDKAYLPPGSPAQQLAADKLQADKVGEYLKEQIPSLVGGATTAGLGLLGNTAFGTKSPKVGISGYLAARKQAGPLELTRPIPELPVSGKTPMPELLSTTGPEMPVKPRLSERVLASELPSASSTPAEKPVVIIRSAAGTHHMGDTGQFAAKSLYSKEPAEKTAKAKSSSKPKAASKSSTKSKDEISVDDVPVKAPREPSPDDPGFRRHGGSVLDLARKYAQGGMISGPIIGDTGGREDAKPIDVASGSFVLPAETVANIGGGNSLAGLKILNRMFKGGAANYAAGGAAPQKVGIRISDGEYVIPPEQVARLGGGNVEQGHRVLDKLVMQLRKQHIETLKGLPGPARD